MMRSIFGLALFGDPCPPLRAADPIDAEVLAVRETAWRAWFGGDEAALRSMLPEEFLAIGSSGGEISSLEKTIAASRAFKASGGRLVSLSFPETRTQRFGDTVVLYGSYEATIANGETEKQLRGRLTEVFVRRDGRWVHPECIWTRGDQPIRMNAVRGAASCALRSASTGDTELRSALYKRCRATSPRPPRSRATRRPPSVELASLRPRPSRRLP